MKAVGVHLSFLVWTLRAVAAKNGMAVGGEEPSRVSAYTTKEVIAKWWWKSDESRETTDKRRRRRRREQAGYRSRVNGVSF
jgi:hypothetical protein